MRVTLLLAVVAFSVTGVSTRTHSQTGFQEPSETYLKSLTSKYDCRNIACPKLKSCEEAFFKLKICKQRVRDRDRDGMPCEKTQCPNRKK